MAFLLILIALGGLLLLMRMPPRDLLSDRARYFEPAPALSPTPALDVALAAAGPGAVALSLALTNITLTEICSTRPVETLEGHAHVFVNGRKRGSLYEPQATLTGLPPGRHRVTVSINRPPAHRVVTVDGRPLSVSRWITIPPVDVAEGHASRKKP